MLRSIASFAFFRAASDGASQISVGLAASALAAQAAFDDASSASAIVDDGVAENVPTNAASDKGDNVVEMPLAIPKATVRDRLVYEAGTRLDVGTSDEAPIRKDPWSRPAEHSLVERDAPRSRPVADNSVRVTTGRALVAVGVVIIGLAAIAIPMLSDRGFYSAARPSNATVVPTQVPGSAEPPVVPRTTVSGKPAIRSENVVVGESAPADGIAAGAAEAKTNARLSLAADEAAAPGPRPDPASQTEGQHVLVVVHGVNLHATAARGSKIVATLPKGLRVTVIEQRGPWTLVEEVPQRARSKKGWVFNTFLKEEDG
jgi:hypothetical protein